MDGVGEGNGVEEWDGVGGGGRMEWDACRSPLSAFVSGDLTDISSLDFWHVTHSLQSVHISWAMFNQYASRIASFPVWPDDGQLLGRCVTCSGLSGVVLLAIQEPQWCEI